MEPLQPLDFTSLLAPVSFGRAAIVGAPPEDRGKDEPVLSKRVRAGTIARNARQRMAAMKAAEDMLQQIPAEGETFHGILLTYVDLANVLTALLGKLGSTCLEMKLATLSLSSKNVQEMAGWLDRGAVKTLDVLVSHFFAKNNQAIHNELLTEMDKRKQRVAVARSHAKIVTMSMEDGRKYTLLSSANLRSNRNLEVLSLTADAGLADWYSTFLSEMMEIHRVQEEASN